MSRVARVLRSRLVAVDRSSLDRSSQSTGLAQTMWLLPVLLQASSAEDAVLVSSGGVPSGSGMVRCAVWYSWYLSRSTPGASLFGSGSVMLTCLPRVWNFAHPDHSVSYRLPS